MVIGVFCNTAIENAASDKELASIKQVYTKQNQVWRRGVFGAGSGAGDNIELLSYPGGKFVPHIRFSLDVFA